MYSRVTYTKQSGKNECCTAWGDLEGRPESVHTRQHRLSAENRRKGSVGSGEVSDSHT